MEEAEAEKKFFVNFGLGALFELFWTQRFVGLKDVGSETRRWLESHLDRVL
jgi:hypothetical protein